MTYRGLLEEINGYLKENKITTIELLKGEYEVLCSRKTDFSQRPLKVSAGSKRSII